MSKRTTVTDDSDGTSNYARKLPAVPRAFQWISRQRDNQQQSERTYTANEERASETEIGSQADENQELRDRLRSIERETNDEFSDQEHQFDKKRITEAHCGSLEVTSFQKDEAVRLMQRLNLSEFGSYGIPEISLAAIYYVVREDRLTRTGELHHASDIEGLEELLDEHGLDVGDLMTLSGKVGNQLP